MQPHHATQRRGLTSLADVFTFLMIALVAGWLLVVWAVIRRPILSVPIAAYAGLAVWLGEQDAQALAISAVVLLGLWRLVHKRSFQRLVGRHLRTVWRRLWVFERRWRTTMVLSGLGKRYRLREGVPKVRNVRSTPWGDRVLMRLVAGQCTEDVERVAPELATASEPAPAACVRMGPGSYGSSSRPAIR